MELGTIASARILWRCLVLGILATVGYLALFSGLGTPRVLVADLNFSAQALTLFRRLQLPNAVVSSAWFGDGLQAGDVDEEGVAGNQGEDFLGFLKKQKEKKRTEAGASKQVRRRRGKSRRLQAGDPSFPPFQYPPPPGAPARASPSPPPPAAPAARSPPPPTNTGRSPPPPTRNRGPPPPGSVTSPGGVSALSPQQAAGSNGANGPAASPKGGLFRSKKAKAAAIGGGLAIFLVAVLVLAMCKDPSDKKDKHIVKDKNRNRPMPMPMPMPSPMQMSMRPMTPKRK